MIPPDLLNEKLRGAHWVVIGSGDGYWAEVVVGDKLLEKLVELFFGSLDNATAGDIQEMARDLNDEDNWVIDPFVGPTHFHHDIGEPDRIDIYLLTDRRVQ